MFWFGSASQSRDEVSSVVTPFPPEVWMEIFRSLDINSLLNVAEAFPNLKDFAFAPAFVRRVSFDPETDERTILKFVQATHREPGRDVPITEYVSELHFTNCTSLSSSAILHCAQYCNNLRLLDCVKCVVEPSELFRLLSMKLTCVTTLQWSLYDERCYKFKHRLSVRLINTFPPLPQLESMFMECSTSTATELILGAIFPRCPMLSRVCFQESDEHRHLVPNAGGYCRLLFPVLRLVGNVLRRIISLFVRAAYHG
ncbi:hypothetical protein HPB50_005712 [Hyalomma asiaticum]|uniref:Uncharacterized protein n=1 Tax=Hyalomma asiaticum TaxID=266040 RepID=A0ACB7RSN4_HYAAI|nr:hypothetical protein HPB50_005712 [Hyalomma asiaticum]